MSRVSPARTYAGRSGDERVAERRARLISATLAAVAEQGGSKVTMTAICARAGLTERYFYESFASRDEAVAAAFEHACEVIATEASAAVTVSVGAPRDRVTAALGALVDLLLARPDLAAVVIRESASHPALRAPRDRWLGRFADLVVREAAELYADRARTGPLARARGLALVAGVSEVIAWWQAGTADLTRAELVDLGADLFEAALLGPT